MEKTNACIKYPEGEKRTQVFDLQRITANSFLHVRQRENVRAF